MEFLRSWIINITVVSIIISIVTAISPPGNIEKSVKLVASGILLLCIIYPFFVDYNIDFGGLLSQKEEITEQYNNDFEQASVTYAIKSCEDYIRQKLSENDIRVLNIEITAEKVNGEVIMNKVYLNIQKGREKALEILTSELKIKKEVIFIEENE